MDTALSQVFPDSHDDSYMLGWKYLTLGAFLGASKERKLPLNPTPFVTGPLGVDSCFPSAQSGQGKSPSLFPLPPPHDHSSRVFHLALSWGLLRAAFPQRNPDGEHPEGVGSSY